jgi:hypothetical protein
LKCVKGLINAWIVTRFVVLNCCNVFRLITNLDLLTPSVMSFGAWQLRLNSSIAHAELFALPTGPLTARTRLFDSMKSRSVGGGL